MKKFSTMEGCGAQDTIYLCNFKVSVDGEWLCLREVGQIQDKVVDPFSELRTPSPIDTHLLMRTIFLVFYFVISRHFQTTYSFSHLITSIYLLKNRSEFFKRI